MGYTAKSIQGSVIRGISETVMGLSLSFDFEEITGTTYTEVWAKNMDLTDIDHIDISHALTKGASTGNPRMRLKWEGTAIYTKSYEGTWTELAIDVSSYTGEGRMSIECSNDTAGQTCQMTMLKMNLTVGT